MRKSLILCCLLASLFTHAQSRLPDFGVFSLEEMTMKKCPFDENAGAVILLDEATSNHDDDYRLITHRRTRIKILDQREMDRGNIEIRFYAKEKFEFISDIKAITYNPETGETSRLDNKSLFTEKEDDRYSVIKFAMPNVKPGCIIEYEYTSNKEHYGGLTSWWFQDELPTVKSCFLLTILPGTEFQYNVQKKSTYPVTIKNIPELGRVYFEMNNIPGLKFEPYMDAVRDYLQRVEFQQASYMSRGTLVKVKQTWEGLAYDIMTNKYFGLAIRKDLSNTAEIKSIVAKETTDSGKIAAVYNYIRNNFTCTLDYGVYAWDGLKTAWEQKKGTVAEINLILVNLLQSFDIDAKPLLVAERDFGKVNTDYPFINRFNKVVAYAKAGGHNYILDATQRYCPPGLTPFPLLNTIAFVADKKDSKLVQILNKGNAYNNYIAVNAVLDDKGMLKGTAEIASREYAKQLRTEKIKADPKRFAKNTFQDEGSELVVDDYGFQNLDDDDKPLIQNVKFHNELNVSGGFIFLVNNLFTGFSKNPFTAPERFTNVNFGYPYDINLEVKVQLPEKSKVDKLPPAKSVVSADRAISASRTMKIENNTLIVTIEIKQTVTLITEDQYSNLKSIYTQLTDLLNEPVVVRVGS